jgi:hypothetical protein
MRRFKALPWMLLLLTASCSTASGSSSNPHTIAPEIATENAPETAKAQQPSLSGYGEPSPAIGHSSPSASAAASSSALPERLARNFDRWHFSEPGWRLTEMRVESENAVLLAERNAEDTRSRWIRYDWKQERTEVLWESADRIGSIRSVPLPGERGTTFCMETYGEGTTGRTYLFRDGKFTEVERGTPSPDGRWLAFTTEDRDGIWGKDNRTGEIVQWTKARGDRAPLWHPDSSRFIFLHDTGKDLGDGAGPETVPAVYEIGRRRLTELPLARGFWGGLSWLTPGKSIAAANGFDDVIGLKWIGLDTMEEKQLLETSRTDTAGYAVRAAQAQVLISDEGRFGLYDDRGDLIHSEPWPSGVYPWMLRYSRDGEQLAYVRRTEPNAMEGKIAAADPDGSRPRLLTPDDWEITEMEWLPSGRGLLVLFGTPEQPVRYVGRIAVP